MRLVAPEASLHWKGVCTLSISWLLASLKNSYQRLVLTPFPWSIIPPPFVNSSITSRDWRGLDNAAWGSHVFHESVAQFDARFRRSQAAKAWAGAPLSLTKFQLADWRAVLILGNLF